MTRGYFITFEGCEGCGKSTQNKKLKVYLEEQGKTVVCTHEPGGTKFGTQIRELILNRETTFKHNHTELLLFIADRLEHVEQVIKPALEQGHIVLCDRYIDSTVAYQCGGRAVESSLISMLNGFVNLTPDVTFLLDIDPVEGIKRAKKRAELDRFEQEKMAFHYRVRDAYLEIAKNEPDRVKTLDVNGKSEDDVFAMMVKVLG